jgi:diguanylate cyclase (GGDEF)-like protein
MLARYGGEEFAVLLPGADLDDARVVLELLRTATPSDQTVSIGYALQEPEESISDTVDRADQALYRAKSKGRDCIVAYESALIPVSG